VKVFSTDPLLQSST